MHLIPLIIKFYFQISLRLFAFVMCLHVGFFKLPHAGILLLARTPKETATASTWCLLLGYRQLSEHKPQRLAVRREESLGACARPQRCLEQCTAIFAQATACQSQSF